MRMRMSFFLRLSACTVGMLFLALSLQAQEKEFGTWTNADFEYEVKPAFTLSGGVEWRTKNKQGLTDRWGLKAGASYSLLPFLKIGAGYELHYRNKDADGWKFRHRYRVDGTLSTKVQRFKLSLRERVQHTFDGSYDEFRLRSRFKLGYDVPTLKIEPYVSVEMYNGLNGGEHFDVKRMRYQGGIVLPFFTRWEVDLFYLRQWEQDERKNIVGVAAVYSF